MISNPQSVALSFDACSCSSFALKLSARWPMNHT
jgi:hypothetical protein